MSEPLSPYMCPKSLGIQHTLATWFGGGFRAASYLLSDTAPPADQGSPAPEIISPASPSTPRPCVNSDDLSSSIALVQLPQLSGPAAFQQYQSPIPDLAGQTKRYVLFGVPGSRRTLTASQVMIDNQSTDSSFFHDLKKCYEKHRGCLRLWFSIWRLEYCEIARVLYNTLTIALYAES